MAAETPTPVDEYTGIPLSIAPPLEYLSRADSKINNWHHLWHPSSAPQLESLGGWALRNSRIQLLPATDHNNSKHNYHTMYSGPPLPDADDEDAQFRLSVLSCAGYLPENVIDIRNEVPFVRPMTGLEHQAFLAQPIPQTVYRQDASRYIMKLRKEFPDDPVPSRREAMAILAERNARNALFSYNNFRYAYDPIRDFFKHYALKQSLGHVREIYIEEFLFTTDVGRKQTLGHWLLAKQSERASEPFENQYKDALRRGSMHPLMPKRPDTLVKYKLGNTLGRNAILPELAEKLLAAA